MSLNIIKVKVHELVTNRSQRILHENKPETALTFACFTVCLWCYKCMNSDLGHSTIGLRNKSSTVLSSGEINMMWNSCSFMTDFSLKLVYPHSEDKPVLGEVLAQSLPSLQWFLKTQVWSLSSYFCFSQSSGSVKSESSLKNEFSAEHIVGKIYYLRELLCLRIQKLWAEMFLSAPNSFA